MSGTGFARPARQVLATLAQVFPIRSAKHVRTKLKYGRFRPPPGSYIISQSLIVGQSRRLAAFSPGRVGHRHCRRSPQCGGKKGTPEDSRRETRSHQVAADRHALPTGTASVEHRRQEPGQSRPQSAQSAGNCQLYRSTRGSVRVPEKPGPNREAVEAAGNTLRKLAARSFPRSESHRYYEMLMLDGTAKPLTQRLDSLDDRAVQRFLSECRREENEQARNRAFEIAYFTVAPSPGNEAGVDLCRHSTPSFPVCGNSG